MNIKEVSRQFNVSSDTLRYWERVGAIPPVHRDSKGYRDFDEEDMGWVHFVKCMRDTGVSVERIIEYLSLFEKGEETIRNRKEILIEQRDEVAMRLAVLQKTYDLLNDKINHYEDHMFSYEGKLKRPTQRNE